MPRARWWAIGALSVLTVGVVALDVTGVIFEQPTRSVAPPPLALPTAAAGSTAAAVEPVAGTPEPRMLRRVEGLLRDPALGPSVHAVVVPLADGARTWARLAADVPATPASTLKLWTAAAVLDAFDVSDRLSTSVAWDEASGTVVLVGGGDATLRSRTAMAGGASLESLARRVARVLHRDAAPPPAVTVDYDTSLFTGPTVSPGWEPEYVSSGVVAPVTALMVDQGMVDPPALTRADDPAATAAAVFAALLEQRGLTVRPVHRSVTVSGDYPRAEPIAAVRSAPMGELVEEMLRNSDNQVAEALGRLAAGADGFDRSFRGAARALLDAAERRGVETTSAHVVDASGLSREDLLSATMVTGALSAAAAEPRLSPILSGLAVAGFDGTLADRYRSGRAARGAGVVRAKTGTLTGISAEAGVTTDCHGVLVSFAFIADRVVDTDAARAVLDEAAATLTSCPTGR